MQEIIDGIVTVGILPVIIGYLLFDHSKKMEAIRTEIIKMNAMLIEINDNIKDLRKK